MSRFIDADKVEKCFDDYLERCDIHYFDSADEAETCFLEAINEVPTEEVMPVVHARWITDPYDPLYTPTCSACNLYISKHVYNPEDATPPYCPNCGAKMDKEIKKP